MITNEHMEVIEDLIQTIMECTTEEYGKKTGKELLSILIKNLTELQKGRADH